MLFSLFPSLSLSPFFFLLLLFPGLVHQQELPSVSGVSDSKRFVLSAATFDLFRKGGVGKMGRARNFPIIPTRGRERQRERDPDL